MTSISCCWVVAMFLARSTGPDVQTRINRWPALAGGWSTPKALQEYGISPSAYSTDEEMFALMHEMRTRIINPAFRGDRIIGAILFEGTMDREIDGTSLAEYLWNQKKIVPFVKVDQGLADEVDGVQLMKPLTRLADLQERAAKKGVFGTKMRSVIKEANPGGIDQVLDQQFEVAKQIQDVGFLPIVEPEVDIKSRTRAEVDELLVKGFVSGFMTSRRGSSRTQAIASCSGWSLQRVDSTPGCRQGTRSIRRVQSSGGSACPKSESWRDRKFSRALLEGLSVGQSVAEFDAALSHAVEAICVVSAA